MGVGPLHSRRFVEGMFALRQDMPAFRRIVSAVLRFTAISVLALPLTQLGCGPHSAPDPVASFVRDHMQPGSAAFFVPSPVSRDESVEAILEVGPPSSSPEELQRGLEREIGRAGRGASGKVSIASRMIANLVTDRECTIVPKDPLDQAISLPDGAKWRWSITPRARGTMRVTVTLAAPVIIDDRETSYRVTSFEQAVSVTVTGEDFLSDLLTWARDHWVILAAFSAACGGVLNWWRRRRTRRRPAGFR